MVIMTRNDHTFNKLWIILFPMVASLEIARLFDWILEVMQACVWLPSNKCVVTV